MGHSIRSHQYFKTIQPRQKVLLDILLPDALLVAIAVIYLINNFSQECSCTCSRVKNLYTMEAFHGVLHAVLGSSVITLLYGNVLFNRGVVCQPFWQVELLLKNLVDSPHDEANDWLWCVPNAFRLTQFGIILRQEVLIEMNHGIVVLLVAYIRSHYFLEVSSLENCHQIIYYPGNTFIKVITCQIVEYLTQKRVGFRNQTCCFLSAKIIRGIIM